MTVEHSPLGLSDIGYHLYTIFLFTKNDIPTAIIPVVSMMLMYSYCCPLHNLPDTVCYLLGAVMQSHSHLTYNRVGLDPYPAV